MSAHTPEPPPFPATQPRAMSLREWSLLILLGVIWGGSFFCARIAVAEMAPLVLVMFRVAIAALALHLWLLWRGPSFRLAFPMAGSFVILAILNNIIPFSLMFYGQTELGAGLAAVLNATTPFWTAILANAFTRDEKLNTYRLAGIALGIAGTAVMIGPGLMTGLGGPIWAKLALVGTALSYGFAFIFARRFRAVPPPVVATGQLTASSLIMIPAIFFLYDARSVFAASSGVWIAVLALALIATAYAYILYFQLIASAGASNTSLVTLIVPVSAMVLGMVFLEERLEFFEIAGMAMIGSGLVTIDGRLLQRRRAKA